MEGGESRHETISSKFVLKNGYLLARLRMEQVHCGTCLFQSAFTFYPSFLFFCFKVCFLSQLRDQVSCLICCQCICNIWEKVSVGLIML